MKLIPVNEINSDLLNELGCESNKINVSFEKDKRELSYIECADFSQPILQENVIQEWATSSDLSVIILGFIVGSILGHILYGLVNR